MNVTFALLPLQEHTENYSPFLLSFSPSPPPPQKTHNNKLAHELCVALCHFLCPSWADDRDEDDDDVLTSSEAGVEDSTCVKTVFFFLNDGCILSSPGSGREQQSVMALRQDSWGDQSTLCCSGTDERLKTVVPNSFILQG